MAIPGFTAIQAAATFPCSEKVNDARCVSDASGNWRCQRGFPGETCYNLHTHFGIFGCNGVGGHPPCDPYGCGVGVTPVAFAQTCRVECRGLGGLCNFAEVTVGCPMKHGPGGEELGKACCTQKDAEQVREKACSLARTTVLTNGHCKTNCRFV